MTSDELGALIDGYSKARLEVYLREVNAYPDRAWQLIIWERRGCCCSLDRHLSLRSHRPQHNPATVVRGRGVRRNHRVRLLTQVAGPVLRLRMG